MTHDYCNPAHCVARQYDFPLLAAKLHDYDGTCRAACDLLDRSQDFRADAARSERDPLWMLDVLHRGVAQLA